jgi:CRP/FNR family cyclic AMP-dependent transcriptional regulator
MGRASQPTTITPRTGRLLRSFATKAEAGAPGLLLFSFWNSVLDGLPVTLARGCAVARLMCAREMGDSMVSKEVGDTLARNAVFSVLSAARRNALAERATLIKLVKGGKLFARGEQPEAAYAIVSGEIEVTIEGPDGRDVFIALLGSGTVIGELGVLDGVPRSTDARATRKTEVLKISRSLVTEALRDEPNSALALLGVLASRLRDTDHLVDRNASMDLGKRLARLLLEEGAKGKIVYNQSDLAHLVGATREAVNRKLSRWRKSNWIMLNHTGLHILDRNALLAICRRSAAI